MVNNDRPLSRLQNAITQPKAKMGLLMAGGFASMTAIALFLILRDPHDANNASSSVSLLPAPNPEPQSIQPPSSPIRQKLIEKEEENQRKAVEQNGGVMVTKVTAPDVPVDPEINPLSNPLTPVTENQPTKPSPILSNPLQKISPEERQKLNASILNQITAMSQGWGRPMPAPAVATATITPTSGNQATDPVDAKPTATSQNDTRRNDLAALGIEIGKVYYARSKIGVTSDGLPPQLAVQLIEGPAKDGILTGQVTRQGNYLTLNFTTLNLGDQAIPINAFGVNPDDAFYGVRSDYSTHWFEKILLPAAAAFVSAFASAYGTPGAQLVIGNDQVISVTPERSLQQSLYTGGAAVGQNVANALTQRANELPTTVELAGNSVIGVVFVGSEAGRN